MTGLVAQQQTVGPLQLPLADVAVLAQVCSNDHTLLVRDGCEVQVSCHKTWYLITNLNAWNTCSCY